jgi:hypothetical protein
MNSDTPIAALFGRTDAGHLAAQVEDLAWLAVPHATGLRILSGWRIAVPMSAWADRHFVGADGLVADESGFRAHVEEVAEHRRQLHALGRRSSGASVATPWGASQRSEHYAEGITFHSTASHGGFHVEPEQNLVIDARLRNANGWYEEDAEWAKVAFTFPSLFTTRECRQADRTLRDGEPDAWEAILGVVLLFGESHVKDQRLFRRANADRWVVISAIRSAEMRDMIICTASRAGLRGLGEGREYLVPAHEYDPGRFGFVIDEARHARLGRAAAADG